MTPTLPMPAKLQPNPNWAKLPLFNRKNWTRVRFGDVARQLKEQVDPVIDGVERYVEGGHMETENVHIRQWGNVGDGYLGPAFIRGFRKGQVLYGSRRTYLKKVAVAEWDGVTANTTYVLEADETKLLQRLLPWLMLSEKFTRHSVQESKGSTNPYINFPDIAKFEFDLPPLDQQRRIAEILWAVDANEQKSIELLASLEQAKAATVNVFAAATPGANHVIRLVDGCHRVTDGTHQPPKFTNEGVPFFLVKTISSGRVELEYTKFVSQKTYEELTKRVRPKRGDILYTAVGATYGVALLVNFDEPFVFQRHIAHIIPNANILDSEYLALFLNSPHGKRQSDRAAIGSAQPTVTLKSLSSFQIPCPPLIRQKELAAKANNFNSAKKQASKALNDLRAVRTGILNTIFP
jgi:restriction endonuclease S subunit